MAFTIYFIEIDGSALWQQGSKFLALLTTEFSKYLAQLQEDCSASTSILQMLIFV